MTEAFGTTRLLSPEEIAIQAGQQTPFLRLPPADVFTERAARLRQLAGRGHPMAGFLEFASLLADAIAPPYDATRFARSAGWRDATRALLGTIDRAGLPPPTLAALESVAAASDQALEAQADRILNGITLGLDFATAPLVAAGLQAHWTALVLDTAKQHGAMAFGLTRSSTTCPCCGSLPVASIERIGAEEAGFRYLQCSLCSSQWHYVRIKCTHCENTKGLHYETLSSEGQTEQEARARAVVRAECCPECDRYLKIFSMQKDGQVEPMADDLATIALDLLLADAGKTQAGVDLMLFYGDPGD